MQKCLFCFIATLLLMLSSTAHGLGIYCEDDPPFQLKKADGSLGGMAIDIVTEIQRRVGNTDPIQLVPWARGLAYLDSQPDSLLFSMSRTAERNERYQWIGPIAETVLGLYTKADSKITITSLEDAKKLRSIGVYRDDVRDQHLTKLGFTNLDRATDGVSNFRKLMAGRFEVFASSANTVGDEAAREGFTAKEVKLAYAFLRTQVFIAASKTTDPAVVAQWNGALEGMKKDGTFKGIFRRYYPDNPMPGAAITKF